MSTVSLSRSWIFHALLDLYVLWNAHVAVVPRARFDTLSRRSSGSYRCKTVVEMRERAQAHSEQLMASDSPPPTHTHTPPLPPLPSSAGTDRHNISSCWCFRGCRRRCPASFWQHFRCHRQNLRSQRGTAPEGSHPWAFSIAAQISRAGGLQIYTGWHLKEKRKQSSAILPWVISFPVQLKGSQCWEVGREANLQSVARNTAAFRCCTQVPFVSGGERRGSIWN